MESKRELGKKPNKKSASMKVCGDCSLWQARGDGYGTCVSPSGKKGYVAPIQGGLLSRKTIACGSFKKCCKRTKTFA